jgi:membrane fusion protein, multidrug efflux system
VNFSVSQNQMAKWQEAGRKGEVRFPKDNNYDIDIVLPGGIEYPHQGRIDFSDPSFSQDTGSFTVRAVLPNGKGALRPGMFVTANLRGATRPNAIVIPQLAVQQGSNGHLVYVVNASDVAEVRPVVVGDYVGDQGIVVVQGLHAGDRVVVDGVLKVVPGRPVKIATTPAAAAVSASAAATTPSAPTAKSAAKPHP